MDYQHGQQIRFRWSYSSQPPYTEMDGTVLTDLGDQLTVRVVDSNMMEHVFHVSKKDIL